MRSSLIVLGLFPLISAVPLTQNLLNLFNPFTAAKKPALYPVRARPRPPQPSIFMKQLRTKSDSLIDILTDLNNNPKASRTIDRVFNAKSNCLSNMEEAIEAIKEGTRLVEVADEDLEKLNSRVETLLDLTDEAEVVREVAAILRVLQPLLTKISPTNPSRRICSASPDRTEAYLNSLGLVMKEFSEDIQIRARDRETFVEAASILHATKSFLRQLKTQTREFQNFCFPDKESSARGIRAMGEIITSLADLSASVGDVRAAEEIRRGNKIIDHIVVSSVRDLLISALSLPPRHRSKP